MTPAEPPPNPGTVSERVDAWRQAKTMLELAEEAVKEANERRRHWSQTAIAAFLAMTVEERRMIEREYAKCEDAR